MSQNNIKITVFGNGWQNIKSNKNLIIKNEAIYGDKFYKTIFSSKINMCFLRRDNHDVYNSKTVEILAAGGFMLSEYSKYIEEVFKDKKDLVFFHDDKLELLKIVRYYLRNNHLREKIKKMDLKKSVQGFLVFLLNYQKLLILRYESIYILIWKISRILYG